MTKPLDTQTKRRPQWVTLVAGGCGGYLASLAASRATPFASEGWILVLTCLVAGGVTWLFLWLYDAIRDKRFGNT